MNVKKQCAMCPEDEICLNNIKNSLYYKENTTLHHYNNQFVNAVQGNNPIYTENYVKAVNIKCRATGC
jgi:hypothetical protein